MLRLLLIDETLNEDGVKWTELNCNAPPFFVLHIIKVYMLKNKHPATTCLRAGNNQIIHLHTFAQN